MRVVVSTLHRGYQLTASVCRVHGGLHAAGLVIEKHGLAPKALVALDYFFEDEQALKSASHWGRMWADMST